MPPKSTKITDVASPGKTAPSASSRPIVVTNRSLIANDPMIAGAAKEETASGEATTAPVINRTAKTIAPVSADMQSPEAPVSELALEPMATKNSASTETLTAEVASQDSKPAASDSEDESQAPVHRDDEADLAAAESQAEAAQNAREQELDQLIESRKYAVPINAVQRKRSRVFVATMCLLALLLALLLVDAVLDVGLFKLPVSVPHTHLFSDI